MKRWTTTLVLISAIPVLQAVALDVTWSGGASADFTNAANWVGGSVPNQTTDRAVFPSAITPFQPTLYADRTITGLVFQSSSGGWVLDGGARTLTITTGGGIDDTANVSGVDTIKVSTVYLGTSLGATTTFGGGNLLISGALTANQNHTLNVTNGTLTVMNWYLGGNANTLTKNGAGTLIINGSCSTGGLVASAGTLILGNKDAVGPQPFKLGGVTLQASIDLTGAHKITNDVSGPVGATCTISGTNSIEFGGLFYGASSGGMTLSNSLANGKTLTLTNVNICATTSGKTLTINGSGDTLICGAIADGFAGVNLVAIGSTGVTTLKGRNTFTGALTINTSGGTVVMSGNNSARPSGTARNTVINSGSILQLQANASNTVGGISYALAPETTANKPLQLAASGTTLQLRSDNPVTFSGMNNLEVFSTSSSMTVDVNRVTSGSGVTLTMAPGGFNTAGTEINVTGANGYTLSVGGLTNTANNSSLTLKPTSATLSVANIGNIGTGSPIKLNLDGTSTGSNTVGSIIPSLGSITLTKTNTGLWVLSASNAYTGVTTIYGGTLRLSDASALPGGIGSSGGASALTFAGGVAELGVDNFARGLGTGVSQVKFTAPGGGFSAFGGKRLVNLGGASGLMTWASTANFLPADSVLLLNSVFADSEVEFQNPINLNARTNTVQVDDNPALNTDFATLSGAVTNGSLVKTGAGKLVLAGSPNWFTGAGLTVSNGTLVVSGVTTSSVLTVISNATILVNGSYSNPMTVQAGGSVGGTGTVAAANLNLGSGSKLRVTIQNAEGVTDALTVSGAFNLANVTLDVVNTNLLTAGTLYRVLTGNHSGTFAGSNLPSDWTIDYQSSLIQLKSARLSGTLIKIQ